MKGIAYEAHGQGVWSPEYDLIPVTAPGEAMTLPWLKIESSSTPCSELLTSDVGLDSAGESSERVINTSE